MSARLRLVVLLIGVLVPVHATGTEPPRFALGMTANFATEVDAKDFEAAMRLWVRELATQEGFRGESLVYRDVAGLLSDFAAGRLDMAAIKSLDYVRRLGPAEADLALAAVKGGKLTRNYLLLVRTGDGLPDLAALRGKRLAAVSGEEGAHFFLETLLARHRLGATGEFFRVESKTKSSQAVLAVFFNQADACIVSDVSFRTMVELNPQIGGRLTTLATSPDLIDEVTVFRKEYDPAHRGSIVKVSRSLGRTPRGRQIMTLFKLDALDYVRESDLAALRTLVAEHERLTAVRGPGR